jgi:solute carrier family 25 protein 34/35
LLVCLAMNPFDVASTRMYNQKTDTNKNVGALYRNGFDCIRKIIRVEGLSALYKGFQAHYLRIGPHTILTFVFLEQLKKFL